jgi:hypothetical protein
MNDIVTGNDCVKKDNFLFVQHYLFAKLQTLLRPISKPLLSQLVVWLSLMIRR